MPRTISYAMPKRLKNILDDRNWDVRTLARVCDIKEQALYDNLKGSHQMSLSNALKLVKGLQVSGEEGILILTQIQQHHERYKKGTLRQQSAAHDYLDAAGWTVPRRLNSLLQE